MGPCSTMAMPSPTCISRGASLIATSRDLANWVLCGCRSLILLLIPFVQVYSWWASGFAGVIPSALAYLAGCAGIYRLARRWLPPAAAALTLAFFATNPNLLYLQTTAMVEPLFICETIWIVLWLVEWQAALDSDPIRAGHLQIWIAAAFVAAVFTRYDGWILAMLAWGCVGLVLMRRDGLRSRGFWLASILVAAAPLAWFIYNAAAFGDWLYFLRGPYSARAIEIRTAAPRIPAAPGLAQSVGRTDLLYESSGAGRSRRGLGQSAAVVEPVGNGVGLDHCTPPLLSMGDVAVAARCLLCILGSLWIGAHLSAGLVASLLV